MLKLSSNLQQQASARGACFAMTEQEINLSRAGLWNLNVPSINEIKFLISQANLGTFNFVDTKRKRVNKSHGVVAEYFWLTHMLFRGIGSARPKGGDDDKLEVTPPRSSGSVSLQNYTPHTNRLWQWWFTRTNLWFSSWLCPFCDWMSFAASAQRQRNTPSQSTRWLLSKGIWWGGKSTFITGKLFQGQNKEDRLITQPPWGRRDLDWWILSSWQSLCRCFMFDIKQDKSVLSVQFFIL